MARRAWCAYASNGSIMRSVSRPVSLAVSRRATLSRTRVNGLGRLGGWMRLIAGLLSCAGARGSARALVGRRQAQQPGDQHGAEGEGEEVEVPRPGGVGAIYVDEVVDAVQRELRARDREHRNPPCAAAHADPAAEPKRPAAGR